MTTATMQPLDLVLSRLSNVGQNGHGLEIHRHIHLTSRFVIPTW